MRKLLGDMMSDDNINDEILGDLITYLVCIYCCMGGGRDFCHNSMAINVSNLGKGL